MLFLLSRFSIQQQKHKQSAGYTEMGQKNKTLAHRFTVKGTVEESIYKLNKSRNSTAFLSGNTKNQDQPFLTYTKRKTSRPYFQTVPETDERPTESESLRHLPPSVAAAMAAERSGSRSSIHVLHDKSLNHNDLQLVVVLYQCRQQSSSSNAG